MSDPRKGGTAITRLTFYETVMAKRYETLVDPDTKVDVNTAMIAAGRLQSLFDTRSGQPDMADILVGQNRIIAAVKSMLPESSAWRRTATSMDALVLKVLRGVSLTRCAYGYLTHGTPSAFI